MSLSLALALRRVTNFSQTLLKPLHPLVDDINSMTSLGLVCIDADAKDFETEFVRP